MAIHKIPPHIRDNEWTARDAYNICHILKNVFIDLIDIFLYCIVAHYTTADMTGIAAGVYAFIWLAF